ncbi:hypothetical protein D3C83_160430 [compost metagenome]
MAAAAGFVIVAPRLKPVAAMITASSPGFEYTSIRVVDEARSSRTASIPWLGTFRRSSVPFVSEYRFTVIGTVPGFWKSSV